MSEMAPLRVLHLTATNARRGAEQFAFDLAHEFERRGIDSTLRTVVDTGADALAIEPLPGGRWSPRALAALRTLARSHDACIAHGSKSLPAMALALGRHVPFVYRSIGDPDYWSGAPLRRARTRFFLRRAQAVTTGWSGARETLVARYGLSPSAVHVIPRGVDASRFAVPSDARRDDARRSFGVEGQLTIAVIGALSPEKRVDRAIDVAERLPNALLLIAGDGPQRAELETMASGRIGQRARFLGVQRDVAPVLHAADVLLVPSDTEGLAGVAIEAAFTRLPAVVTDVGGMRDIVVDGETGYVVATDAIDEMARNVERAAQDRHALGVAAQRHCLERFELSPVVDRWEALVRDVAIR